MLIEAKKDDFEGGLSQLIAEMFVINSKLNRKVYGIVTNANIWLMASYYIQEDKIVIERSDYIYLIKNNKIDNKERNKYNVIYLF